MTGASRDRRVAAAGAATLVLAALLAGALALARGGGSGRVAEGRAPAPAPGPAALGARPGAALVVTRGPFERALVVHGKVTAARSHVLKVPLVSGWRTTVKWLADEGKPVAEGDPVAQLDASVAAGDLADQENRIEEKKQQLVLLEADRRRADLDAALKVEQAELEFAQARIDAAVPADVIGARNHQERQLAHDKARAKRDEARRARDAERARADAEIAKARLELDTLRERQERARHEVEAMTLRAPAAGVVVHAEHPWFGRKIRVGENLQATFPVIEIPDPASLEVEAFVPESEAGAVRPGQPVALRLDAFPTRALRGTVAEIAARGEERREWGRAFYFRARIVLDALDPVLRPGMSAQCAVEVFRADDVLRVPLQAAAPRGGAFAVRPRGRAPLEVRPLAVNEFVLALPATGSGLAAGDELEPDAAEPGRG